jgi:uncharacterized membrane protein
MGISDELTKTAAFARVETIVFHGVQWVHTLLEATGAVIIAVGAVIVVARLARRIVHADASRLTGLRLVLARFLTLALEFQLAADVLATTIAPGWQQIGELAAIAVIRTTLNFSLTREIASERKELGDEGAVRKSNMAAASR